MPDRQRVLKKGEGVRMTRAVLGAVITVGIVALLQVGPERPRPAAAATYTKLGECESAARAQGCKSKTCCKGVKKGSAVEYIFLKDYIHVDMGLGKKERK
jgi:hypothetical protein